MSTCNDFWCDYYGKENDKCDRCEKKDVDKDEAELRVSLKRRADNQMELDKTSGKYQGQQR